MTKIDGSALDGVSATTLWTLRNRAVEARRPDAPLDDPWAVKIFDALDGDYDRFGKPRQAHALRALAFDRAIRDYAAGHPHATVVALGEGLQTSYWRIADDALDWLTVDLAPVIELRGRLLPEGPRTLALSALDRSWLDEVDPDRGVIISAEGLLMYLDRAEVISLIADCAARFPGGAMIFDSIPRWFSKLTMKGLKLSANYTAPPMPNAMTVAEAARLPKEVPGVARAIDIPLPPGRPRRLMRLASALGDIPPLKNLRPAITLLHFSG